MGASSSDYSQWNIDEKWSSQEWKSGEMLEARTERPVDDKFVIDDDMDSDTATESNLFVIIQIILAQVNHRLRNVYVFNIGSICTHGKELLRHFTFYQKYREQSHFETDV